MFSILRPKYLLVRARISYIKMQQVKNEKMLKRYEELERCLVNLVARRDIKNKRREV